MKPDPTVLIIDGEREARRLLRMVLEPEGYRVFEAEDGETALNKVVECKPDVMVLEVELANEDGLALLQQLQRYSAAPILVLSAKTDEVAKATALDAGASDYLAKPFSSAELLARLRVLLRPIANLADGLLLIEGDLVVDQVAHEIALRGRTVKLTPKEGALLSVLARYAGKVVTCSHLLRAVWGVNSEQKIHDLRVLVLHLRKKLEPFRNEAIIRNEEKIGYSLLVEQKQETVLLVG